MVVASIICTLYTFIGYCFPAAKPVNKLYSASSHGHLALMPLIVIVEQSANS